MYIMVFDFSGDKSTKVGFLGIGIMGFPMAQNLIKAGYAVLLTYFYCLIYWNWWLVQIT